MEGSVAGYPLVPHTSPDRTPDFCKEYAVLTRQGGEPFAVVIEWFEPWEQDGDRPLYAVYPTAPPRGVRFMGGTHDFGEIREEIRRIALEPGGPAA